MNSSCACLIYKLHFFTHTTVKGVVKNVIILEY